MEEEIAGKILSLFRNPSKNSQLNRFTTALNNEAEPSRSEEDIFPDNKSYFSMDLSFSQYIAQSVDGLSNSSISRYEDYNYCLLKERKNCTKKNLWTRICSFLDEYHETEDSAQELFNELKQNVSLLTGIKAENELLESATLIIFNLYIKEKTAANRKEELQRIFNVNDFKYVHKVTNIINEILKLLNERQLEDFYIKWDEVFKERIEDFETKLHTKRQTNKLSLAGAKSSAEKNICPPKRGGNVVNSSYSAAKFLFFKHITFIEKLRQSGVRISVENCEPIAEKFTNKRRFNIVFGLMPTVAFHSNQMESTDKMSISLSTTTDLNVSELRKDEIENLVVEKLKLILGDGELQNNKCKSKVKRKKRSSFLSHQVANEYNVTKTVRSKSNIYGKKWIEKQLTNVLDGTVLELVNHKLLVLSILDLIMSELSNEDLEVQLMSTFDTGEDFVRMLLKHREDIIDHCKLYNRKKSISILAAAELDKLKDILFQQRLEIIERNSRHLLSSIIKSETASTKPAEKNKIYPTKVVAYPHVYDLNLETKYSSSFISGTKIMLPENHERKDMKMYEEVFLPLPTNTPPPCINERIKISSLDKIGQIAFHGMESLNCIQSVVFNTAYKSNENLLICAPTGAGKTNIALLTIIHEIKHNIEDGVIQKDRFKIVYIAPMKALASEMTKNFSNRLQELEICVKELTGDMQLTKREIANTQMLVTTPEKWDLVTRKGDGDTTLSGLVKLLIIDEVHLLHSDRGPVIEALVARTLRQVETSQKMIRIVGLSATLPNYKDVATFLRVNPQVGLFYFDSRFRPVPLTQCFIGVKARKPQQQMVEMNQICYDKMFQAVKNGNQVMIFVHARNATVRTALALREIAQQKNQLAFFEPDEENSLQNKKLFGRAKSNQLNDLLACGFSVHHAGLLRYDRTLVEDCFLKGLTKVLVCTATLAWGVNLPANTVIIKGTEIYDAKHGSFVDLGILDVLQIFGRAGRPQFNEHGAGIIITTHNKLHHYLSLMMNQFPIESRFISYLADNLNAEITLGTINCIEDAIEWLNYTYLFVRMRINPQEYGINYTDVENDYSLFKKRKELIEHTAKTLDRLQMIRYNEETGKLSCIDLGRTASYFYVKYGTIEIFNTMLKQIMYEPETLHMLSQAQEFEQLKIRDEEMAELDELRNDYCSYNVAAGSENLHGKVNILLQTFLSRGFVKSFSLVSDLAYISQNVSRLMRALFDIVLKKNNPLLAGRFLSISQMFERQQWNFETPLRQFVMMPQDIISKIENRDISIETLREMDAKEIGIMLRNTKMGGLVKKCVEEFPILELNAVMQPITRAVLRVRLNIKANFVWNDKIHGKTLEPFWVWVEDPDTNFMYHSEYFCISRKQVIKNEVQELVFTIPVHEPLPSQYVIRVISDRWLGSISQVSVSLNNVVLPELHPVQTELLPLQPLPVSALQSTEFEALYKFTHFNPIQTQIFHCLYHTDNNVLLGAPTGSGKTIVAEIAFFRVFREYPNAKVVYIAPLKALVKERIRDWKVRFQKKLKKEVVELTGDVTPDIQAIASASIIVTTPEKWDSISRSWQTRNYVRKVVLIVIDEIHLLGEDRGPVLEVIVSRTNFIVSHTNRPIRVIGLSTALANAQDLANWLRIEEAGMYNFRPSVRPVPLEVHISAFPGKYYCPRMASMNKPAFQAIKEYSASQPVLIFVSSRRQTRLTAMDLLAQLASENNPKQWLRIKDNKMNKILVTIKDDNLKMVLAFGIGIHHAGLQESDRKIVEELFEHQHIQVLVATATLAWGVNFPAHLVIVKGTEYFDCKSHRYVDMPITDILQMMGRAGRPQFDKEGIAVVMVHDVKKNFYKKFLYEPFPVESNLLAVLPDHLNAEIVAGTVKTCQEAVDYLTWTYFFRRLLQNPIFYEIKSIEPNAINEYLTDLIKRTVITLENSHCLMVDEDGRTLYPTSFGRISSYYYISHQTMLHFKNVLSDDLSMEDLIHVLSHTYEYNEIPVRHNEEIYNSDLASFCPIKVDPSTYDSPYTKTHLLLQAHFSRLVLPCTDYQTDLKSVLDQAIRILQAMIDVCGERGWLVSTLRAQQLMQMLVQGRWITNHPILTLPCIEHNHMYLFAKNCRTPLSLPSLFRRAYNNYGELLDLLQNEFDETQINKIYEVLCNLPNIKVELSLSDSIKETKLDEDNAEEVKITTTKINVYRMVPVKANSEYVIHVKLTQMNKRPDLKVHAPRFSKPKDESWFLTLGEMKRKELLAMKRLTFGRRTEVHHNFTYNVPDVEGVTVVSVYLMSDSYLGLDQQYNVKLNVVR